MDSFNNRVGLWIPCGNQLACDTAFAAEHALDFCFEFSPSVKDDFGWPWISRQPCEFQIVGDVIGTFLVNTGNLEPSSDGIDHCEAVKGRFLLIAKLVWTDEVDAQCVPRNRLRRFLRRKFAVFLFLFLCRGTDGACLAYFLHCAFETFPVIVLAKGEL